MSEIMLSVNSGCLRLIDVERELEKESFGAYLKQVIGSEEIVAYAYEDFLEAVAEGLSYTFDIQTGASVCENDSAYTVHLEVETDVSTIFRIHKDAYMKYGEAFDRWLRETEDVSGYPKNLKEFFEMLEGEDVDTAVSAYLTFFVKTTYTEGQLDACRYKFTAGIGDMLFGL